MTDTQKTNAQWCIDRLDECKLHVTTYGGRKHFYDNKVLLSTVAASRIVELLRELMKLLDK